MAAWIAPAIGAVGSILGGLFGGKKEETTSSVDYSKMVRDAEKAGFNPLTAIRNGGSAGFTTTHHPALSAGSFISSAMNGVANVVEALDPMRQATADLEFKIRQETLSNLQADTAARRRASIGGVPVSSGAQTVRARSGAVSSPKIPDLFVPYRDNSVEGGGKIVYLPNSDVPELDQMIVPSLGIVGDDTIKAVRGASKAVSGWVWPSLASPLPAKPPAPGKARPRNLGR